MMIMAVILKSQNMMIISKYHPEMAYQRYIKDQYILMISNCNDNIKFSKSHGWALFLNIEKGDNITNSYL